MNREGDLLWSYNTGGSIGDISVSADGSYIAAGVFTNVYFFNHAGKLLWSFYASGSVCAVSVSSGGAYIAAGSADKYVFFFADLERVATTPELTPIPSPKQTFSFPEPTVTSVPHGVSSGTLSVSSMPSGAGIYLDGTYKGSTPLTIYGVSVGEHIIQFENNDWVHSTLVNVPPGETVSVFKNLSNYSALPIMATDNEITFCSFFYETFIANVFRYRFHKYKDIIEVESNGL